MSKASIEVLLSSGVTVIFGRQGVGKTALLLEAAAEHSNRGKTSLVVLRSMPANEFYDKMMNLGTKYNVENVAVVKIRDFDGDFSYLTKDANTFDRVFFEGIYSEEEFLSLPSFVENFTFETRVGGVSSEDNWADFVGVCITNSGKEVIEDGK